LYANYQNIAGCVDKFVRLSLPIWVDSFFFFKSNNSIKKRLTKIGLLTRDNCRFQNLFKISKRFENENELEHLI